MAYLLFAGEYYYPNGGIEDFVGAYPGMEEAKEAYLEEKAEYGQKRNNEHWGQIVTFDGKQFQLVGEFDGREFLSL